MTNPPIAITLGDPAGVGPDILLKLASHEQFSEPLVVIADRDLISGRSQQINIPIDLPDFDPTQCEKISIIHIPLKKKCTAGKPNPANSEYVLQTLHFAATGCLRGDFSALVTGPINKAVINQAGVNFSGHTEYLAELTNAKKAVMMFTYQQLRLALLTTHIPLSKVHAYITRENIIATVEIIHHNLKKYFNVPHPKIAVTGLNPHAGENGYLGIEEITIIEPAINELRERNFSLIGPLSADTIFHATSPDTVDCILSLYHDQSLPVIKTLGFGEVVNVTLGLPIIRTSVDHGTAFDLAGTGLANAISLVHAIRLAVDMVQHRHE